MRVFEIGHYVLRNYVLETPIGLVAIDTGYPGGLERFEKKFEQIAPLKDLKYIFLTHAHDDHAGFLADLLEQTEAKVILHPKAAPVLQKGENTEPPGSGYSSRLAATFGIFKKEFRFPPVGGELLAERAQYVAPGSGQFFLSRDVPLRILFLPGHTADSIGLLNEETGALYAGDAAMNAVISRKKHTIWIDDADAFGKSWDVMLAAKPTKIYPAHGNPFPPSQLRKHRDFLRGRTLIPMKPKRGVTP